MYVQVLLFIFSTDDGDYLLTKDQLTFTSNQTTDCARVLITDDDLIEDSEFFLLFLNPPETFIDTNISTSMITILDDDGESEQIQLEIMCCIISSNVLP